MKKRITLKQVIMVKDLNRCIRNLSRMSDRCAKYQFKANKAAEKSIILGEKLKGKSVKLRKQFNIDCDDETIFQTICDA